MSKFFELLQEVGGDEELFRTSDEPASPASVADGRAISELEKEELDRVLHGVSFPEFQQSPEQRVDSTLDATSEESLDSEESLQRYLQEKSAVEASEALKEPIKEPINGTANVRPLPDPLSSEEIEHTEPQSEPSPEASRTVHGPASPRAEASPELFFEWGQTRRKRVARRNVSKPDWIGAVKAGVENWKSRVQSQISQPGTDLEALAREEGIKLVQRVFHRTGQDGPRVAIFSGLENGPGSASICIRTAEVLAARREGPVCVVDADFGSPSLHQRFGVENINGLSEATLGSSPIEQFIQHIPERDLWLMPTGKAFTQVTLSGIEEGLRTRIAELRAAFRFVIIHAGTLRLESSAMQLSGWTDGIVLVVEANSTRRELVKRMKGNLLSSNVNLLGVVLNNRTFPIPEAIYRRL